MRMEWLGNKLHEQADQAEESLSKDPLAGRHEIIKQEKVKAKTRQAMEQTAGNHRCELLMGAKGAPFLAT